MEMRPEEIHGQLHQDCRLCGTDIVAADFAEMESRPGGGGAGAIVWALGAWLLAIGGISVFVILRISKVL